VTHILSRVIARAVQGVCVVLIAASLSFAMLRAAPGDPYSSIDAGARTPPEVLALRRAQRGLDLPRAQQYLRWISSVAQGNLGWSSTQQRAVSDVLADTLPRTLLLMALALVSSMVCGVVIGAWQGTRIGSIGDRITSVACMLMFSLPEFWIATVLLLLFTPWAFPVGGLSRDDASYLSLPTQIIDRLWHVVLPWGSLTLLGTAFIARYQRAAMRDAYALPFVQTARAKGLTESAVARHALRAALRPVVSLAGLLFPSLFAGAVFVENAFSWPGMGYMMLVGLNGRDYDLIAGGVILIAALTVVGNLGADLLGELVDPRTRIA